MDFLTKLIRSAEHFIRYLLSGVAIYSIYLLSVENPGKYINELSQNPFFGFAAIALLGFIVFSIYRSLIWASIDFIFLRIGWSVMNPQKGQNFYAREDMVTCLSNYILWRKSCNVSNGLSEYLYYRWAIVHFNIIVAFAIFYAEIFSHQNSIADRYKEYVIVAHLFIGASAITNLIVMCGVERKMYNNPFVNDQITND